MPSPFHPQVSRSLLPLVVGAALAAAAGQAMAGAVQDATGDLRAPFDADARSLAAFDLTGAAVRAELIGERGHPQFVGDIELTMTLNGQIPLSDRANYIWVINRGLGAGLEQPLFSPTADPDATVGDAFIRATADGQAQYVDLSGVAELAAQTLRLVLDGDALHIFVPADLLLAPAGGEFPEGYSAFDIRFSALTGADALIETLSEGAVRPQFLLADRAPEGPGFLTARNFDPPQTDAPVPEPSAWTLMILGFGAAGGLLRRRLRPSPGFGPS